MPGRRRFLYRSAPFRRRMPAGPLACRVPPRQAGRFRPPGRVPFGTARKEPKGGLGAQPRLNSGQRASLVRRACPLRTPVLRGSKTGAAFSYRRTPADTPSDARRPPAFCRPDLPHFCHAYGRLILVFKPSVCASIAVAIVPRHSRRPGGVQIPKHTDAGGRRPSGEAAQPRVSPRRKAR